MTRPILGYDASIVRTNTRMCDVFPRRAHRVPVDDSEHEVRFITQRIQNHIVLPSWITSGESRHVRDGVPWRAFIRADGAGDKIFCRCHMRQDMSWSKVIEA
jgi:hypothetical protein